MKTSKKILSLLLLSAMIFTMIPFAASAANAYWGFDEYDTIDQPGAPEEITSYPTTITKVNNSTYTMTSVMEGVGTISISLIEETWGTFNLGNWKLTTTGGTTHTFVDASTDMEYVHQYYYDNSEVTWSGGNHGGEALESLKFYNGETGAEISLSVGQSATVNILHVIEKTNLLHFPDANNDSINDYTNKNTSYTEDQIYAKLTRKYTFTGPQIKLNVDYLYTKDSYHARNYSCMFPVSKKYSYYCDMIDKDGALIKTIATRPYGDTSIRDYDGPQNPGNEATRAIVYSTDYPNYQFDMRVNTYKDSLNEFKDANYKTSYWDMNKGANKLYFTRFDEGKKTLHEKGKEVHTECIWLFRYVEEGRQPSEPETPISRDKTYTNDKNTGDLTNTFYGAKLTDGVAAESFDASNNSWYFFNGFNGANVSGGKGEVIIDLESEYQLNKVRAHLANNVVGMSISAPKSVVVSASKDNLAYENIASLEIKNGDSDIYWTGADITAEVVARYVKFTFELNGFGAYVNELEVYGKAYEAPEDPNLAAGLDYTISGTNEPVVDPQWNVDYSAKLTDGIYAKDYAFNGGHWFMFSANSPNVSGGKGSATIDFDKICEITKFKLHLINNPGSNVKAPKEINVYTSVNGIDYELAGKMPIDATATTGYWSELLVENISAGSVKFEFILDGGYCPLNEIEIRGIETDEDYVPETGDGGNEDGDTSGGDTSGGDTSGGDTSDGDTSDGETSGGEEHKHDSIDGWQYDDTHHWKECSCGEILDKAEHKLVDGDNARTCEICEYVDEHFSDPEPEFMLGDVNQNSKIDMTDYILLKRNYFGTYDFDEVKTARGDCNQNGQIDMTDYILLKRAYFGTYTLEKK